MATGVTLTLTMGPPNAGHRPKTKLSGHPQTQLSGSWPSFMAAASLPAISPDYTHLVLTATATKSLAAARSVHATIVKSVTESDLFLLNHILNMYCKCRSNLDAHQLFDKIPQPNVVTYNILIASYARSCLLHQASAILHRMLTMGLQPDFYTFSALLSTCTDLVDTNYGAGLHAYAIKSDCNQHVSVATALISMYSKYGSESSAVSLFRHLRELDLVTCNSMITAFTRNGNFSGALKLLIQMKTLGICPDQATFLSALKAASSDGFLPLGTQIHAQIIKAGFETNIPTSSALITMYSNHGTIDLAYRSFAQLQPSNSLILWTAMIAGFNQNNHEVMAINLFSEMQAAGIKPDQCTYASVLQACMGLHRIEQGKQTHAQVIRLGFFLDTLISNLLIPFYGKCCRAGDGFKMFNQIKNRDCQSSPQLILLCLENQCHKKALKLFIQMISVGFEPEHLTVITIIQVCTDLPEVKTGQQLHGYLIKQRFLSDIEVATTLVTFYSRHRMIDAAHKIFRAIPEPDTVLWTALIAAYEESGDGELALKLFLQMIHSKIIPDDFTLSSVLSSCANLADFVRGRAVHAYVIKNMPNTDILVGNALISLYSECKKIKLATNVFHQMPDHDTASWASMIAGYTQNGQPENTQKLFTQVQKHHTKPDEFVISAMLNACSSLASLNSGQSFHALSLKQGFASSTPLCNSLITMYSRCGNIDEAYSIFKEMGSRNLISWNTLLSGLAQNGRTQDALWLFDEMGQTGICPNATTFIAILSACSHQGLVCEGKRYFDLMRYNYSIEPTEDHYCCMVDLFSRAGYLNRAKTLIRKMPFSPSVSVWMALLSGCRLHGNVELGELAAKRVMLIKPNESPAYVLLANIYAEAEQWDRVKEIRETMRSQQVKKEPGCSWIEADGKIHIFTVKDNSHQKADQIYRVLEGLHKQIKVC